MKAIDSYPQCAVLAAVLAGTATIQAQQTTGMPGSPGWSTTIDGR